MYDNREGHVAKLLVSGEEWVFFMMRVHEWKIGLAPDISMLLPKQ